MQPILHRVNVKQRIMLHIGMVLVQKEKFFDAMPYAYSVQTGHQTRLHPATF